MTANDKDTTNPPPDGLPEEWTADWREAHMSLDDYYAGDYAGVLLSALEALATERKARLEAEANYRFVVDRVADEKLDGYRELGTRAAAAESECDDLRAQVAQLTRELEEKALAIQMTVELADSLVDMAESGAGFHGTWGERVAQAVEPLRDIAVNPHRTLEHNKILLVHNSNLISERDEARAELAATVDTYEHACSTIAAMHAAAVGEVTGPARGVVEDVADVAAANARLRELLREALPRLRALWVYHGDDEIVPLIDAIRAELSIGGSKDDKRND